MIEYRCPACDKQAAAPDSDAGKKVACSCGNVNIVPGVHLGGHAAGQQSDAARDAPALIYQGRPSQLANLRGFIGLFVLTNALFWFVRPLLGKAFKESAWDWYLSLIILGAYLLWLGWKILVLKCTKYTVTSENILLERGVLFREIDNIDLFRVTDVNLRQNILQRILGTGNILIASSDKSKPDVVLADVTEPRTPFENIRRAALRADKERGVLQIEH